MTDFAKTVMRTVSKEDEFKATTMVVVVEEVVGEGVAEAIVTTGIHAAHQSMRAAYALNFFTN